MYNIRLPGKLAFYDAGPKYQNTRRSRTGVIYAQYRMAPLDLPLFVSLSLAFRKWSRPQDGLFHSEV